MSIWIIILSLVFNILSGYGSDRWRNILDWQADFILLIAVLSPQLTLYSLNVSGTQGKIKNTFTPVFPTDIIDFWARPPLGREPYCLKCEIVPGRCFTLWSSWWDGIKKDLYSKKKITVAGKLIILRNLWTRLPFSATPVNAYEIMGGSPKSVFPVEKSFVADDIEIVSCWVMVTIKRLYCWSMFSSESPWIKALLYLSASVS